MGVALGSVAGGGELGTATVMREMKKREGSLMKRAEAASVGTEETVPIVERRNEELAGEGF